MNGTNVASIVEQFGGTTALAALCEVEPSAVSQWKAKNRIPKAHVKFLRLKRPDLFGEVEAGAPVDDLLGPLREMVTDEERQRLALAMEKGPSDLYREIEALEIPTNERAQLLAAAASADEKARAA